MRHMLSKRLECAYIERETERQRQRKTQREIIFKKKERKPAESAVELPVRLSPAAATSSVSYHICIERGGGGGGGGGARAGFGFIGGR
jgi:hypothetical protein